jgi:TRAP-type mannitol/chloroaromatic compound transport system permease small subunit
MLVGLGSLVTWRSIERTMTAAELRDCMKAAWHSHAAVFLFATARTIEASLVMRVWKIVFDTAEKAYSLFHGVYLCGEMFP